jgi:glycine/D-amino acid oxidase-like deaminating enzyme
VQDGPETAGGWEERWVVVVDAVVVGAGIIGATVSAALRLEGMEVINLDDGRPMAGTAPSGGHLKPGWFGGLKKTEYEPAMDLLDRVWGLHSEPFRVYPLMTTTIVYRVDTDLVLASPRVEDRVVSVRCLHNYPLVCTESGEEYRCRLLVLATGAWVRELVPNLSVKLRQGVSFRLKGDLREPFILPWAPFKQVVAHQHASGVIWAGDGSAILPDNWDDARTNACLRRCMRAVGGEPEVLRSSFGFRAYHGSESPCLLHRVGPRTWVAAGAGKMGTIAAGWCAVRIMREMV